VSFDYYCEPFAIMKTTFEDIQGELTEKGFRWTGPRERVLKVFFNFHHPMTPAEVFAKAGENEMDFASVYRTIELFRQEGVLVFVDAVSEGKRYELSDKYREHHHHLICQRCGKTEDFEDCFMHDLEKTLSKKSKFKIESHDLKFFGVCEACN